jgi:hypothetical protein
LGPGTRGTVLRPGKCDFFDPLAKIAKNDTICPSSVLRKEKEEKRHADSQCESDP